MNEATSGGRTMTPTKPAGRLQRHYRLMWDINHGFESYFNPPMAPETAAMSHFGQFEGGPVDAYVGGIGPDAGYVTAFKSKKTQMEYLIDRYERGAVLGDLRYWKHAENLKRSAAAGVDHLEVHVDEAHRLGIDPWFRLSMNDWHHVDTGEGKVYRLGGSRFYEERLELLIGERGAAGWSDHPQHQEVMTWLQDYVHDEVRAMRRDIAIEVCERYDCTGFLFDFMRVPGYFAFGEERKNAHLMTQLIRETRRGLDEVAKTRGRPVGLAVRLPPTLDGTRRLGLDVEEWVADHLVDVVVSSPFFAQDLEHDVSEWVALAADTPVTMLACLEEGYLAGHNGGFNRWFYNPPLMSDMTDEMIRGLAARHHDRGVDGIYVFNWFGSSLTYDHELAPILDDVVSPDRLRHRDKSYALTRSHPSFPNCLKTERQIPVEVTSDATELHFDVVDDVTANADLVRATRLLLHLTNVSIDDDLEVTLNGAEVTNGNPLQPSTRGGNDAWQIFDLAENPPRAGQNVVTVRARTRNERTAGELPISVEDAEIEVSYEYPTGTLPARTGAYPGSPGAVGDRRGR